MCFIALGDDFADCCWGRLVGDGGGDDVDHVSRIAFDGNFETGIRVEAADGSKMNVTGEDGGAEEVFGREALEAEDKVVAFGFMVFCAVVVVKVVEEIGGTVEFVEDSACDTYGLLEIFYKEK